MPSSATVAARIDVARARALWCHLQLLGRAAKSPREALLRAGWVHTIGGVDAYVSLWSRCAGLTRASVDAAVSEGSLWIAPGARGCTMLVPREELGLALLVGTRDLRKRTERDLRKAGASLGELVELGDAVLALLESRDSGMTSAELREALPDGAVRSLGEAGKKVGLSSTLPPALRLLEADGVIGRRPLDGRLDVERYAWHLHERNPLSSWSASNMVVELASRYFRYAAPATVRGFAGWAGVGQREAARAVGTLGLEPVEIEGAAELGYVTAAQLPLLREAPAPPALALIPFRDNYTDFRVGIGALVHPSYWASPAPSWGSSPSTLGDVRNLLGRGVLAGGRLVGLWDYDPETQSLVAGLFDEDVSRAAVRSLGDLANAVGVFIRDEIGHSLLYRQESQRSRAARITNVRRLCS